MFCRTSKTSCYSNVEHIAYVNPKNLRQGYAYRFACTLDKTPTNLSASQTANTYIASQPGEYYFRANVAGNGVTAGFNEVGFTDGANEAYPLGGTSSISGNGVRWSGTNSRWLNQNNCISNVYYSSGNIYFTATGAKGNAKITLIDSTKDPDEIWTWTIWCTDQPGTISGFPSRVTANLSFTVMDRNLGAITATPGNTEEVYGLYYQWGHYIGFSMSEFENLSEETGYNMAYSYGYYPWKPMTKYSDTYWTFYPFGANDTNGVWGRLWGAGSMKYGIKGYAQAKKTMYDPCPPGYRVLPYDAVMGYNNPNSGVSYDSNGYGIYLNGNVFFPYNGNVYKGGATWMAPGSYVYVWTNIHVGANMGCMYYYVRSEGAGGIDYTVGHIISRGMGVRCVVGS